MGVDPGSSATGWAVVAASGNRQLLEEAGVIRPRGKERSQRLAALAQGFAETLDRLGPDCAAVETPFSGRNPRTSLVLAESRGVLLAELGRRGVEVASFSPAEIKAAVVGNGRAHKEQVVFMVMRVLGLTQVPASDAADAMATALTYINTNKIEALWRRREGVSQRLRDS